MEGAKLSTATLYSLVLTVVLCLVEKGKRGGHGQEEFADKYARMVNTTTSNELGILMNFEASVFGKKLL